MKKAVPTDAELCIRGHFFLPGMRGFGEMDREKSKGRGYFRRLNNCFSALRDL